MLVHKHSKNILCSIKYVVVKALIQKTTHYPNQKAPLPNSGNLPSGFESVF